MNQTELQNSLRDALKPYGFVPLLPVRRDEESMGGWCAEYHTDEFRVIASQDRTDDLISICVGSRIRRKPATQMRGPWSLGQLRGFLDGQRDHYLFDSVENQIDWLSQNITTVLQTSFLNSDPLNQWAVEASRRLFG